MTSASQLQPQPASSCWTNRTSHHVTLTLEDPTTKGKSLRETENLHTTDREITRQSKKRWDTISQEFETSWKPLKQNWDKLRQTEKNWNKLRNSEIIWKSLRHSEELWDKVRNAKNLTWFEKFYRRQIQQLWDLLVICNTVRSMISFWSTNSCLSW